MPINMDALDAAKRSYRIGVEYGARKFEAAADKIPDRFAAGLRNKYGEPPSDKVLEKYRSKVQTMKEKYAAYARNPDADKWARNWVRGLFGKEI